jgi:hypothetical protein
MPSFNDWIFGSEDKFTKLPNGNKQQQGLHNDVIQKAMQSGAGGGGYDLANQYYNNLLGPNQGQAFNQFSQPYMQQFNEQTLPQIAERFAGGGALSSSGFGQALGGAASGLQAQLAQLFSQLQGNAAQQQYGQYNQNAQTGLNYQPFSYQQQQGSGGLLNPLLTAIGTYAGGPIGAGIGNLVSSGISSLFKSGGGGGGGSSGTGGISAGSGTGKYGLPNFLGM